MQAKYKVDINILHLRKHVKMPELRLAIPSGLFSQDECTPGDKLPVLKSVYTVDFMQWGWVPPFFYDSPLYNGNPLTFCKAEALPTHYKPILAEGALHRCLVIASSFFSTYVHMPSGNNPKHRPRIYTEELVSLKSPFLILAGLSGVNAHERGGKSGFAIVSKPAVGSVKTYTDRVPLILTGDDINKWLTCSPEACIALATDNDPYAEVEPINMPLPGSNEYSERIQWLAKFRTDCRQLKKI